MDIPVVKQGKFIIVDTTLKSTDVMYIDEMNGDLGDANRKVYLAIKDRANSNDPKDPLIPMNLNGRDVRFQGQDADGIYKRISLSTKIINAKAGLVEMTLPRQLYMAVGSYKSAEFEVYEVNGDTHVSSARVGIEVYDNLVHMSVGENKVYIDEAEKLISDLEKLTNQSLDSMRKSLTSMENGVTDALANIKRLETLVDIWQQMVKDNGVAEKAGNNVYTGNNVFEQFIQGHITGTVIKRFTSEDAPQDMNNVDVLREMKVGTSESSYYSDNQLANNPMSNSWVFVTRHKISAATVYETAMTFDGKGYGVLKARTVGGLDAVPALTEWGIFGEWGTKWRSLVPYLSDEFIAHSTAPEYRIIGGKVEFRGAITAKKTITNTNINIKLTKELPFNFIGGQEVIKVSGGPAIYALFAYGNKLEMQKHQIGGVWADIGAGNYIGISSAFDIQ